MDCIVFPEQISSENFHKMVFCRRVQKIIEIVNVVITFILSTLTAKLAEWSVCNANRIIPSQSDAEV